METTAHNTPATSGFPNTGQDALSKVSSSAHAAVGSIASAADEAVNKAKPAIDRVAAVAHQAVDKVAVAAAPTAEWLSQQGESLNATQKKVVEDVCKYVSANPLKALAMAAAAGFLLGRIINK